MAASATLCDATYSKTKGGDGLLTQRTFFTHGRAVASPTNIVVSGVGFHISRGKKRLGKNAIRGS